ncbi:hypothetical protein H8356DRAFT_1751386 [Neocallimastix lanati (nom. inval.)]|nr:hypothetical protein H8356DRAFT_1751386 [Neocallimastix sp. JGI-2020a]
MGLKSKIKGSYLYTQWKLGKYTKRRVKHSNYVNYLYEDDNEQDYPVNSSTSYSSYPSGGRVRSHHHNKEKNNQNVSQDDNVYRPAMYNRMAYYPTMDENEER